MTRAAVVLEGALWDRPRRSVIPSRRQALPPGCQCLALCGEG